MKNILTYKKKLNVLAEVGWQEKKTTEYISSVIREKPIVKGFSSAKTGLLYKVGKGKKSILLRADIDALQTVKGPKHTCGHSTHTAALLGAYAYAKSKEAELNKKNVSLYFLFQPAEETFPSGAHTFVSQCKGIADTLSEAYALHVSPLMKAGIVGLQPGPLWARGDYMEIEVTGKVVHIKDNEKGIDAIGAGARIISLIPSIQQTLKDDIRMGIGVIQGGIQANTVAGNCIMKGDIRLKNDSLQPLVKSKLHSLVRQVEKETNTRIQLRYYDGYPVVVNNAALILRVASHMSKCSPFRIQQSGLFSFGCEDFSYISQKIPSVVALIGTGDAYDLHEELCTISDEGTKNAFLYITSLIDMFLA